MIFQGQHVPGSPGWTEGIVLTSPPNSGRWNIQDFSKGKEVCSDLFKCMYYREYPGFFYVARVIYIVFSMSQWEGRGVVATLVTPPPGSAIEGEGEL